MCVDKSVHMHGFDGEVLSSKPLGLFVLSLPKLLFLLDLTPTLVAFIEDNLALKLYPSLLLQVHQ